MKISVLDNYFKLLTYKYLFFPFKESSQWPIVEPLPSYGQGLDLPGPRHRSLINGYNLTDVVITGNYFFLLFCLAYRFYSLVHFNDPCMSHPLIPGNNGVIDGQGSVWWQWLRSHKLNHSRPHLVEFLNSEEIVISNLTFLNSPAWSIHPVYCRCNAINLAFCVRCGLVNVSCICTNAYSFCFLQ